MWWWTVLSALPDAVRASILAARKKHRIRGFGCSVFASGVVIYTSLRMRTPFVRRSCAPIVGKLGAYGSAHKKSLNQRCFRYIPSTSSPPPYSVPLGSSLARVCPVTHGNVLSLANDMMGAWHSHTPLRTAAAGMEADGSVEPDPYQGARTGTHTLHPSCSSQMATLTTRMVVQCLGQHRAAVVCAGGRAACGATHY